jgi:hypothetical protein
MIAIGGMIVNAEMNATAAMIARLAVLVVLDLSDVGLAVGARVAPAVDQLVIVAVATVAVGVIDFGTRLALVVHLMCGRVIAVVICDMALTCVASTVVVTTLACRTETIKTAGSVIVIMGAVSTATANGTPLAPHLCTEGAGRQV